MTNKLRKLTLALGVCLVGVIVAAQNRDPSRDEAQDNEKRPSDAQRDGQRSNDKRLAGNSGWEFGDPLANLDAANLAAFQIGVEEFLSVETVAGGLGPIFNNTSCAACHFVGAIGGASNEKVTRFGQRINDEFDGFESAGGTLLQAMAIDPAVAEVVPKEATIVVQRVPTPVFGAGLIEAIDDETIKTNALRRKPEGVRGRVAIVTDAVSGEPRIGRFGWKAQHATLLAFAGAAYRDEMGVTNRFFPQESAPNGNTALAAQFDTVADLEDAIEPDTGLADVDHLANFMRFLAPPPQLRPSADAVAGGKVFEEVACAACHTPMLLTGASTVPALAYQQVPLFSDLLLHDMGSLADGIAQDGAKGHEIRTAPLWGIRARTTFLHDGRASNLRDAINQHAGEASRSRALFAALGPAEQQQLIVYLNTN